MKHPPAELIAAAAPGAAVGLALAAVAALLAATLSPAERQTLWVLLEPRLALVFMLWLVLAIAGGTAGRRWWQRHGERQGKFEADLHRESLGRKLSGNDVAQAPAPIRAIAGCFHGF